MHRPTPRRPDQARPDVLLPDAVRRDLGKLTQVLQDGSPHGIAGIQGACELQSLSPPVPMLREADDMVPGGKRRSGITEVCR